MKPIAVARLMRPKQWTKNLLVFAALIFSHQFLEPASVIKSLLAFVALCLVSSAVYVLNDLLDVERDKQHPVKKTRPIAAGQVTKPQAVALLVVLALLGCSLSYWIGFWFFTGIGWYIALQVAYNFLIKNHPVVDVFFLSIGFVLRAVVGAVALESEISRWLLFCTLALALLLGSAKRRHEFMLQGEERGLSRKSLLSYTQISLDVMVVFSAATAGLSYGIYALQSKTAESYPGLVLTAPFVLFGILRYLFLVFAQEQGGEPENLVFDPQMLLTILGFMVAAMFAMKGLAIPHVN